MKNKRADINYIYLIIILISILLIGIFIRKNLTQDKEVIKEEEKSKWQEIEKTNEEEKSSEKDQDKYNKIISTSNNSEEGFDEKSKNEINTDNNCTEKTLSYSIIILNKEETCIEHQSDYCIEKIVNCSAKIVNNDLLRGYIKMKVTFLADSANKETESIQIIEKDFTLDPKKEALMSEGIIIKSSEEGIANQKINCFFNTLSGLKSHQC